MVRLGVTRLVGTDRLDKLYMAHAQGLGELEQGHHGRIAPAAFQAGEVLLAVPGALFDLLLGQTGGAPDTGEVAAHQPAHIHKQVDAGPHTLVLQTIVCIGGA